MYLAESGICPLKFIFTKKLHTFLKLKLIEVDLEEPFHAVYRLCQQANIPGYRFLTNVLEAIVNINPLDKLITSIRNKPIEATKSVTYKRQLNPSLTVHPIYK